MADQRDERLWQRERPPVAVIARHPQQRLDERALRRVPAVDRIAIVRGQKGELFIAIAVHELDRRGKAAEQGRNRRRRYIEESKRLTRLLDVEDTRRRSRRRF